jgi:diguanylate cyclase (GGDEF)-like protein
MQALIQARRYSNSLAVLFLDLDDFKPINDRLGHATGDELLRQVAQRIDSCVREEDSISRLGGDEFTMVLHKVASHEDAALVAQNIITAMQRKFYAVNEELMITVSIGISFFPDDGEEPNELVHRADVAMYVAKSAGGNTYRFYSDEVSGTSGTEGAIDSE